jgi:4-hydroxy-tetrahydrodipicolinate reductase
VDVHPAKDGKDAGELAELGRELGDQATTDRDALIALAPDAIVHTAMADDRVFECIEDLSRSSRPASTSLERAGAAPVAGEILPPEMIARHRGRRARRAPACTSTASTPASPTTCCRW